jgi:hypothetical protein
MTLVRSDFGMIGKRWHDVRDPHQLTASEAVNTFWHCRAQD